MNEETPQSDVTHLEHEEQKEKSILILFRFIVVPLVVVGVVVFIIVLFGNIALKEKSVRDYLYDIRTGSQSERWQAAYHLSNLLANPKKDYAAEARKQLPEIILIFDKAKGSDPEIRRYLALALGRLKDDRAVPALEQSVNDEDSQTVIWSIWALGSIGDQRATPIVMEKLESQDEAVRSMSAYVLGALKDRRGIPLLQAHLDDTSSEVTWNSAIALARMGDPAGSDILLKMMDRAYLNANKTMTEQNKEELIINAVRASLKLSRSDLNDRIKQLSTSDPSPRVRDTAIKGLSPQGR